jgi:hypothetical protein
VAPTPAPAPPVLGTEQRQPLARVYLLDGLGTTRDVKPGEAIYTTTLTWDEVRFGADGQRLGKVTRRATAIFAYKPALWIVADELRLKRDLIPEWTRKCREAEVGGSVYMEEFLTGKVQSLDPNLSDLAVYL